MTTLLPDPPRSPLTPAERRVAAAIREGLSYKEIASKLGVSYHTVNTHVAKIHKKLKVSSNVKVAMLCHGLGMLKPLDFIRASRIVSHVTKQRTEHKMKFTVKDTFNDKTVSNHRTIKAAAIAQVRHARAVEKANGRGTYIQTVILCDGNRLTEQQADEAMGHVQDYRDARK